jgi:hypothetical protein
MLVVIFLTLTILASACIDPTPPVSGFTPTWFCPPSDSGLSINELLAEYYCEGSPNPLYKCPTTCASTDTPAYCLSVTSDGVFNVDDISLCTIPADYNAPMLKTGKIQPDFPASFQKCLIESRVACYSNDNYEIPCPTDDTPVGTTCDDVCLTDLSTTVQVKVAESQCLEYNDVDQTYTISSYPSSICETDNIPKARDYINCSSQNSRDCTPFAGCFSITPPASIPYDDITTAKTSCDEACTDPNELLQQQIYLWNETNDVFEKCTDADCTANSSLLKQCTLKTCTLLDTLADKTGTVILTDFVDCSTELDQDTTCALHRCDSTVSTLSSTCLISDPNTNTWSISTDGLVCGFTEPYGPTKTKLEDSQSFDCTVEPYCYPKIYPVNHPAPDPWVADPVFDLVDTNDVIEVDLLVQNSALFGIDTLPVTCLSFQYKLVQVKYMGKIPFTEATPDGLYSSSSGVTITAHDKSFKTQQCQYECKYGTPSDPFVKCIDNTNECTSCGKDLIGTRCVGSMLALSPNNTDLCSEEPSLTLPVTPSPCLCDVYCDNISYDYTKTALAGEISSTATKCLASSFRPSTSFCVSPASPQDYRQILCVFTNGSFAGIDAEKCDGVELKEQGKWMVDIDNCTTEYQCPTETDPDALCTCPGTNPDDDNRCDNSSLFAENVSTPTCSFVYDNGTEQNTHKTTDLSLCCAFPATTDDVPGSNCICPCIEYEWTCTCHTMGLNSGQSDDDVPCDCVNPLINNPINDQSDICLNSIDKDKDNSCSILPVTVHCQNTNKFSADFNKLVDDSFCLNTETKPLITTFTCPPSQNQPLGSEKCPLLPDQTPVCYNNNQTVEDSYNCNTCIDTTNAATSRIAMCTFLFSDLSVADDQSGETGEGTGKKTVEKQFECGEVNGYQAQYATCIGDIMTNTDDVTRGDAIEWNWKYIGPVETEKKFIFAPFSTKTNPINEIEQKLQISEPQSEIKISQKKFSYIPSLTIPLPFTTTLYYSTTTNTSEDFVLANGSVDVNTCDAQDGTCVQKVCAADNTTCPTDAKCIYNPTTTFTSCQCDQTKTQFGPACSFDSSCDAKKLCNANGNALFSTSSQCSSCSCDNQWTGDKCDDCDKNTVTAYCTSGNFNPQLTSKSCSCQCWYGFAGPQCKTQVSYGTITLSLIPPADITIGTSWEFDLDNQENFAAKNRQIFTKSQKFFLNFVTTELRKISNINTLEVVEIRVSATDTSQYTYIVRFNYSGTNTAAWNNLVNSIPARFLLTQTSTKFSLTALPSTNPSFSISSATLPFDPNCFGATCPQTSPYSGRTTRVDCVQNPKNTACVDSFGLLNPPVEPVEEEKKKKSNVGLIVGLVVAGVVVLALILVACLCYRKHRRVQIENNKPMEPFPFEDSTPTPVRVQKERKSPKEKEGRSSWESPVAPTAPAAPVAPGSAPKAPRAPKERRASTGVGNGEGKKSRKEKDSYVEMQHRGQNDHKIPHPWKQCSDHLGNLYYMNMNTGETSFERP